MIFLISFLFFFSFFMIFLIIKQNRRSSIKKPCGIKEHLDKINKNN
jgi:preprotein translocase subunit YajC